MDRFTGEPSLAELLADPILQLMMRADGCDMSQLATVIENKPSCVAPDWKGASLVQAATASGCAWTNSR
jgi:hypothetical protein